MKIAIRTSTAAAVEKKTVGMIRAVYSKVFESKLELNPYNA